MVQHVARRIRGTNADAFLLDVAASWRMVGVALCRHLRADYHARVAFATQVDKMARAERRVRYRDQTNQRQGADDSSTIAHTCSLVCSCFFRYAAAEPLISRPDVLVEQRPQQSQVQYQTV